MTAQKIAVMDYGAGNLRNVCKALEHVGGDIVLTDDPAVIRRADKFVLPGVGAFADCANGLRARGLWDVSIEAAHSGKPFLGICVGMQLLFDVGEEMGTWQGLGLMRGRVVRFDFVNTASLAAHSPPSQGGARGGSNDNHALKVPHIGWNNVTPQQTHPLINGITHGGYAYFVHSFHAADVERSDVLATTDYGYDFPSVVAHANIMGIQFHPEKSQDVGLQMLKNFVEM